MIMTITLPMTTMANNEVQAMIVSHGYCYGYDTIRREWFALNYNTGKRYVFRNYEEANRFVEHRRA